MTISAPVVTVLELKYLLFYIKEFYHSPKGIHVHFV